MSSFLSSFSGTSVVGISIMHWLPPGAIFSSKHYLRCPLLFYGTVSQVIVAHLLHSAHIFTLHLKGGWDRTKNRHRYFLVKENMWLYLKKAWYSQLSSGLETRQSMLSYRVNGSENFELHTGEPVQETDRMETIPVLPFQSRYLSPNLLL